MMQRIHLLDLLQTRYAHACSSLPRPSIHHHDADTISFGKTRHAACRSGVSQSYSVTSLFPSKTDTSRLGGRALIATFAASICTAHPHPKVPSHGKPTYQIIRGRWRITRGKSRCMPSACALNRMSTVRLSEMRDMVRTTEVNLYSRAAVAFEGHHAEKTWSRSVTWRGHSERSCLVAKHGAREECC